MMRYELSDDEPELETLNISNDQYYLPLKERVGRIEIKEPHEKSLQIPKYGSKTIRHSLPAYDLWKAFFPTYLSEAKFRTFHRPKLRHYNTGPQAKNQDRFSKEYPIKNLTRHIFRTYMRLKSKVITAINERMSREDIISKFLLIKHARELSAKDGELFLFEYCEEYPPVLSQVGMAANIKTYIYEPSSTPKQRSKGLKSQNNIQENFDKTLPAQPGVGYQEKILPEHRAKQIYYNSLKRGSQTKFIENNLYRAPIFEHALPSCDFLVIRTRNNFYVREVQTIFTVGQELPLTLVPPPSSANILRFRCELSNLYIHKLFKASETKPPTLSLEKLLKLFPDYSRSTICTRMRVQGAKYAQVNGELVISKGDSNYGDISTIDLRNIMRPEVYCLNMSMLAARQRLRELNYSETMIFPEKRQSVELEPEVLAAPWNTSKAVIAAMNNRSYLDLERHLIDPTGPAREGFSCIAWVKSPTEVEQSSELKNKTSTTSNGPLKFDKNPLSAKITQEKLRRLAIYQKEAQLVAQIQSDVLSNKECLTSSEDEDDLDDDSENFDSQQVADLSKLIIGGKTAPELNYEKEEEERRQMLADLCPNSYQKKQNASQPMQESEDSNLAPLKNKILMITRTFAKDDGTKYNRTEIIRDPSVMELYVKKKGGTLANKTSNTGIKNVNQSLAGDSLNKSVISNSVDTPRQERPRCSLGPDELCRADGTRLIISSKVLEGIRPVRGTRSHLYVE